jgi:hypothetical protein
MLAVQVFPKRLGRLMQTYLLGVPATEFKNEIKPDLSTQTCAARDPLKFLMGEDGFKYISTAIFTPF